METEEPPLVVENVKPVKKEQGGLKLFWKLGRAKGEKERIHTASLILKLVGSSSLEINYTLSRLVKGLASNSPVARQGFFICLTEFLRQTTCKFSHVSKLIEADLKPNADLAKGEEADFLVARLLVISSVLRAGMDLSEEEKESVIDELLDLGSSRSYLTHPSVLLLTEHFTDAKWGERTLIKLGVAGNLKIGTMDLDHLFLLLTLNQSNPSCITDQILEFLGVKKILSKKAVEGYSRILLGTNLPPSILAKHPILVTMVKSFSSEGTLEKFWSYISSEMSAANNKGTIGWLLLKEISKVDIKLAVGSLSTNILDICKLIASKDVGKEVVNEFWKIIIESVAKKEVDRLGLLQTLLDVDICWEKSSAGHIVKDLLFSATPEEVEIVSKIFLKNLLTNDKTEERVHCGGQIVKLVGLPQMKVKLEWRGEMAKRLAEVSLLKDVEEISPLSHNGREQMSDVLSKCLEKRFGSMEDSVTVLGDLVSHVRNILSSGKATRLNELDEEQIKEIDAADKVLTELQKIKGQKEGKDSAVFLYLYYHLWLQSLSQPEMSREVFSELHPVYRRWTKDTKAEEEEPDWIEVVVEILLSLLAQNSTLLRSVVGSAFSGVCEHLTQPALVNILAVLKDTEGMEDDDSEDEDEDDNDEDNNDEDMASDGDSVADDEEESDSENDSDDEEKEVSINEGFAKKVSSALGGHDDVSDEESDIDMDLIPDEDMAKLDQKLADAFKSLGGRDEAAKKKARMSALAKVHFKLRVLDVIEIYLSHQPKPEFLATIISSLLSSLEVSVRDPSQGQLTKRLLIVFSKLTSISVKDISAEIALEALDVLDQLFSLGSSGSILMTTVTKILPKLCSFLLKFGEVGPKSVDFEQRYISALDKYLVEPKCVLPMDVFSLAMSRNWVGCWSIAFKLAEASFDPSVRMFRRVSTLSLLVDFLRRKHLIIDSKEELNKLSSVLMPSLIKQIESFENGIAKMKPKFVENNFLLLSLIKENSLGSEQEWINVTAGVSKVTKNWPNGNHFNQTRKVLKNLASKLEMQIEFIIAEAVTAVENGESTKKGKKKKKKKNQDALKEAKARKMKLVEAETSVGVPSFSDHVSDNINDESIGVESTKRKSPDNDESVKSVKKKKSKKS